MAYYRFEPFGEDWKQTSYVCSMLGNTAGGKKGGGRFTPEDFLPAKRPTAKPVRQSPEEMLTIFRAIASRQSATAGKQKAGA